MEKLATRAASAQHRRRLPRKAPSSPLQMGHRPVLGLRGPRLLADGLKPHVGARNFTIGSEVPWPLRRPIINRCCGRTVV